MKMTRLERITSDPATCHGKPTVRGLRHPVEMLLELLASGMTIAEILEDYPDLEHDDLLAALIALIDDHLPELVRAFEKARLVQLTTNDLLILDQD